LPTDGDDIPRVDMTFVQDAPGTFPVLWMFICLVPIERYDLPEALHP
jgi:hypothetical protein